MKDISSKKLNSLENTIFPKVTPASFKAFYALAFFLLLTISTSAAVSVDNSSTDRDSSLLGLSSMTWTHTVGGGTEKALYVGVSSATTTLPVSALPSLLSVDFVTYNGIQMTRVGSVQSPGLTNLGLVSKSYVDVYRLINPPSGTHNVVVTFTTLGAIPPNLFVNQAVGGAVSYNGVDQITPNGNFASNSGTGTAPSVVVNGGTTQDLIMDVLTSSPNAEDFTAGAGQTLRWQGNFPAVLLDPTFDLGAGSTKTGAASVTTNWTLEDGNGWALGGLAVRAASNPPSVITVNTNLDNESNGCAVGNCTLREAVNDANNSPQPDTIVFAANVTGTIVLTGGQLVADSNLTINGPGARNLAISGNNTDRVFVIATPLLGGDNPVNISRLTIKDGFAQPSLIGTTLIGDGGGILNGALLDVLSGVATLNLTDVTIAQNRATTLGGGIATRLGAITNIYSSTISNNISNAVVPAFGGDIGGGGISNVGTSVTNIINSTITDNNSLAAAGGIINVAGIVNITNSTISHNDSAVAGGGLVSTAGVVPTVLGVTNVRNTIIANNNDLLGTNILGRDVVGAAGSFNSLGNNIIGSNFGAEADFSPSVWVGDAPNLNPEVDLVGSINAGNQVINPLLGALQNNGGATNTRIPQTGSPAIDRGNNCVLTNTCSTTLPFALTNEQRGAGYPRRQSSAVEAGAVEANAPTSAETVISGRITQSNGKGIYRAVVTLTDSLGTSRTFITNPFGAFNFVGIEPQQNYFIQVRHKQYVFTPQVITPIGDLHEIIIVGTPLGGGISIF